MSIPLVQNNEKDSINTSIIAIKRNIERINMLLGLSNSEEIDTSKFATKDELQQAVTDLQPVDEVTVGNMHSVTSNAVANTCTRYPDYAHGNLITTEYVLSFIAQEDCYCEIDVMGNPSIDRTVYVDGVAVSTNNVENDIRYNLFHGYIKKGQTVSRNGGGLYSSWAKIWRLR